MITEPRNYSRITSNLLVTLSCDGERYSGRIDNLSAIGLFIATDQCCAPGSRIGIELHVSDRKSISLRGNVVWKGSSPVTNAPGIGVSLMSPGMEYLTFFSSLAG